MIQETYAHLLTVYRAINGEHIGFPITPHRLDTPAIERRFWLDTEREMSVDLTSEFSERLT